VAASDAAAGPRHGRVTSFDARRGLGVVTDDRGASYDFHATAVADGSRRIDEGAAVTFSVVPGHRGRYEARLLVPDAAAVAPASHQSPA
jgi:cold shock CspA family protein